MSPLRVCLVALIAGGRSGVPRYAVSLSRALDEVAPEFDDLSLTLLTTRSGADAVDAKALRVRPVSLGKETANAGPGRIVLEQLHAATARADLLHFFDVNGPLLAPWRAFTMTIHDASVVRGLRPRKHDYKRVVWPWAMRRARAVVAVSEFAREEAIRLLRGDPGRIVVAHSGPGLLAEAAAPAGVPELDGGPYLLYVGNITAAKNLGFLVRAFDQADVPAGSCSPALASMGSTSSAARSSAPQCVTGSSSRTTSPTPSSTGCTGTRRRWSFPPATRAWLHAARGDGARLPCRRERHPRDPGDLRRRCPTRPARRRGGVGRRDPARGGRRLLP